MTILVYIVSDPLWTIPSAQVARLRAEFPHHHFVNASCEEEARRAIADAEVVFSSVLTPALFAAASRLRWLQSPAAGVGRSLFPEMRRSDVVMTNARGMHAVPIAEHVMALALALARQLPLAIRRQMEHRWAKDEIGEAGGLHDRRLGIVGLGAIGTAIARLGQAFGMQVSAIRRRPESGGPDGVEVLGTGELERLLSLSDYVVLSAPLTAQTARLITSRELRCMKPTSFLINVARGKLVREEDLARELKNGTIAGAGLDVFEHEPLDPASPLWDLPNVIVTPHTSGFFHGYWEAATDLFAENLRRYERGEPLANVVDKEAGY